MKDIRKVFGVALALVTFLFLELFLTPNSNNQVAGATPAAAAAAFPSGQSGPASSLPADVQISPEDLAKLLQAPAAQRPMTIHVGFYPLYAQAHIPGSEYLGPASQPEGLEKLRRRVEPLPRKKFIVLYCGCCPWNHCPTLKRSYQPK